MEVSLRQIRTGTALLSPGYVYKGGRGGPLGRGVPRDEMLRIPLGAFLLEHPGYGPILVDTGMHPVVATDPAENLGRAGALVARGVRMGEGEHVPGRLRAWGIDPADVRLVVMTHLHADHTSAMSELPNATFVVTPAEWAAARSRLGFLNGYLGRHLPDESRVRFADVDGEGVPWEELSRTVDLLGDGSVRLVSTPGHTVGHVSVLVQTGDGPVFALGDAVYTLRNLEEDLLPWRTADDERSVATMRELRAFASEHPDVPLIPTHDPGCWPDTSGSDGRP
jgi:glyoxylase-like metal-dependent hydrolase (beta-lactamase superfamily II)